MRIFRNKAVKLTGAVMISSVLTLGLSPVAALADTSEELQSQVDQAKANLDDLYEQASNASEDLNQTKVELDDVNQQIDQNTQDIQAQQQVLSAKQQVLAGRVHDNYTAGGSTSLLSIVLGSSSFEDLWQNIYYSNKISEEDAQAISDVKDAKAQLEAKESELEQNKAQKEQLASDQESQVNELNARSAEAQSYYDGLSQELKDAIAAEEAAAAEAARQQAEAEAAQAAAEAAQVNPGNSSDASSVDSGTTTTNSGSQNAAASDNGGSQQASSDSGNNAAQSDSAPAPAPSKPAGSSSSKSGSSSPKSNGGSSSSSSSTKSNTSQNLGGSARSIIVTAAYSQVGTAYVWGTSNPGVSFDCSGLVMYCYAQAGISVPHSSASLAAYCNKSASEAQAGDIVWRPGHVGICIGGGRTIEAMMPGVGVTFGTVSSFQRAGSPA